MANHKRQRLAPPGEGKLRPKPVKEVEAQEAPQAKPAKPNGKAKPTPSSAVKNIQETTKAYAKAVGSKGAAQNLELDNAPAPKQSHKPGHRRKPLPTPSPMGTTTKEKDK